MNVPPIKQPPPPNRFIRSYTVGGGPKLDTHAISTMATTPNEGSVDTTPPRIVPLGTSSGSKPVSIPALMAGQSYVATATISLPLLPGVTANSGQPNGPGPTPKTPAVTHQQDQLLFRASMTVDNPLTGLHVSRFTAVPQARSGSQVFNAAKGTGNLPPGQNYSSFQVFCTVIFEAVNDTSTGVVTIGTEGTLTRQAAGGSAS